MTKNDAKNIIVGIISSSQGCKATDLAVELAMMEFGENDPLELLNELVKENRIIEIEYVLPQMGFRVKSFYLPVGTEIRVLGTGE